MKSCNHRPFLQNFDISIQCLNLKMPSQFQADWGAATLVMVIAKPHSLPCRSDTYKILRAGRVKDVVFPIMALN